MDLVSLLYICIVLTNFPYCAEFIVEIFELKHFIKIRSLFKWTFACFCPIFTTVVVFLQFIEALDVFICTRYCG